jgi:RNA ligase
MYIDKLIDPRLMAEMLEQGYISSQTNWPLTIYNYTPRAQFENRWNEATSQCRGLIVDFDGNIVARPFRKFLNYGQEIARNIPNNFPIVYDKLDGSLAIIHQYDGRVRVATRGSFNSDQAIWATNWLKTTYPDFVPPVGVTPLCEIIYPENRIVVDYKGKRALVLLAAVDIETGADIPLWGIDWWPGEIVRQHYFNTDTHNTYMAVTGSTEFASLEGVVLVWHNPGGPSFRVKIKHPEYIRLHRIVTGISTKTIWQHLSEGRDLKSLLQDVPDELFQWVETVVAELNNNFESIHRVVRQELKSVPLDVGRKKQAEIIKQTTYPHIMFRILDCKEYENEIWKMIKPTYSKPFILDTEA